MADRTQEGQRPDDAARRLEARERAEQVDLSGIDLGADHYREIIRRLVAANNAAVDRVAALETALREQAEPIMDERFRDRLLRHALSNHEVGELVDAIYQRQTKALNALAGDAAEPETPQTKTPDVDHRA